MVADGDGWRAPHDDELLILTKTPDDNAACCSLFSVPVHLQTRFWAMLDEEATDGSGDFVSFSDELAQFLTFKNLPPPKHSICELLVQDAGGTVTTDGIWSLINFGEEPVQLAWPQLQLRIAPGEGFQMTSELPAVVVPPAQDEFNTLFAIRLTSADSAEMIGEANS